MGAKKIITLLFLTSCSYKPVHDSRGLQGKDVSYRYHDDLSTCTELAKQNTPVYEPLKYVYNWTIRPQMLWLPDKWQYSYKEMIDVCMENRGHSIITKRG